MKKFSISIMFLCFLLFSQSVSAGWVRGYFRRDGTYVSGHYRRSRGSGFTSQSYIHIPQKQNIEETQITVIPEEFKLNNKSLQNRCIGKIFPCNERLSFSKPPVAKSINFKPNARWLNYYTIASIQLNDSSNIEKVEYITQFKETEKIWKDLENKLFCRDTPCFVNEITNKEVWKQLNHDIDILYLKLKSKEY